MGRRAVGVVADDLFPGAWIAGHETEQPANEVVQASRVAGADRGLSVTANVDDVRIGRVDRQREVQVPLQARVQARGSAAVRCARQRQASPAAAIVGAAKQVVELAAAVAGIRADDASIERRIGGGGTRREGELDPERVVEKVVDQVAVGVAAGGDVRVDGNPVCRACIEAVDALVRIRRIHPCRLGGIARHTRVVGQIGVVPGWQPRAARNLGEADGVQACGRRGGIEVEFEAEYAARIIDPRYAVAVGIQRGNVQDLGSAAGLASGEHTGDLEVVEPGFADHLPGGAAVRGNEYTRGLSTVPEAAELAAARNQHEIVERRVGIDGVTVDVQRAECQGTDRERRQLVGQRLPVSAPIGGAPYTTVDRADEQHIGIERMRGDGIDRTDNTTFEPGARDTRRAFLDLLQKAVLERNHGAREAAGIDAAGAGAAREFHALDGAERKALRAQRDRRVGQRQIAVAVQDKGVGTRPACDAQRPGARGVQRIDGDPITTQTCIDADRVGRLGEPYLFEGGVFTAQHQQVGAGEACQSDLVVHRLTAGVQGLDVEHTVGDRGKLGYRLEPGVLNQFAIQVDAAGVRTGGCVDRPGIGATADHQRVEAAVTAIGDAVKTAGIRERKGVFVVRRTDERLDPGESDGSRMARTRPVNRPQNHFAGHCQRIAIALRAIDEREAVQRIQPGVTLDDQAIGAIRPEDREAADLVQRLADDDTAGGIGLRVVDDLEVIGAINLGNPEGEIIGTRVHVDRGGRKVGGQQQARFERFVQYPLDRSRNRPLHQPQMAMRPRNRSNAR